MLTIKFVIFTLCSHFLKQTKYAISISAPSSEIYQYHINLVRDVGSMKRLGGTGFESHFWIMKRALKNFPGNIGDGGWGKESILQSYHIPCLI